MIYILLTTSFPYGEGEVFINNELKYLPHNSEMFILPMNNRGGKQTYKTPANCSVIHTQDYHVLLKYFRHLLKMQNLKLFIRETGMLVRKHKMHKITLGRAVTHYMRAVKTAVHIMEVIEQKAAGCPVVLYSYWASVSALSFVFLDCHNIFKVSRLHGIDLYEERHDFSYIPYREQLFRKLDAICPVSENGKKYLCGRYKDFPVSKCYVSRLGTQDGGINPWARADVITIVSCSNIIPVKRVGLIADALMGITTLKINWVHFGDGIMLEQVKKSLHCAKADRLRYRFMGNVKNKEIYKFYQRNSVDLFVNVSESEGIPVSIMEALSFGIPVAATNAGGTNEAVNDKNGWLLDSCHVVKQLRSIIVSYSEMETEEIEAMRNSARSFWQKNYYAKQNYTEFYRKTDENSHQSSDCFNVVRGRLG